MKVRAKFKVTRIEATVQPRRKDPTSNWSSENTENVEMRTIVMSPVYGNGDPNHENTKFWNASPAGEIKLGTINPEAWKAFELDKEVYVDFTQAE